MTKKGITNRELIWALRDTIDSSLDAYDILLLHTVISCLNKKHQFQRSKNALAHLTRTSSATIKRRLINLIKSGYLSVIKRGTNISNVATLYQFHPSKLIDNTAHKLFKGGVCETPPHQGGGVCETPGVGSVRPQGGVCETPLASVEANVSNGDLPPQGGESPNINPDRPSPSSSLAPNHTLEEFNAYMDQKMKEKDLQISLKQQRKLTNVKR